MKRVAYCLMLLFIFFAYSNVLALDECTTSELKRLKELAKNVEFKYEYEIVDNRMYEDEEEGSWSAFYSITAHNLMDGLKIQVNNNDLYFTTNKPKIDKFLNGENVNLKIFAYTTNKCSGELLKSVTVKLPYWNQYSLKEECKEYPDFKYCQEFGKFNISNEKFNSELEKYKNGDSEEKIDDFIQEVSNMKIYIIIGVSILIFGIISFVLIKNKKKKERDL